MSEKSKKQATLKDWSIVRFPDICTTLDNPAHAFAEYSDDCVVVLLGKAADDPRYNADTGEFSDGHRLITTPIIKVEGNEYHTQNTVYILADGDMWEEYRK